MDDKYRSLPDIDHDSQNVFETSDIESENDQPANVHETEDRNIEAVDVNVQEARKRFSNDVIIGDLDIINFSGMVDGHLGSSGFRVTKVIETTEQKLARIAKELEEVKLSQAKSGDSENELNETEKLVNLLEELVSKSNKKNINMHYKSLEKIFSDASNCLNPIQLEEERTQSEGISNSDILTLESKISAIENLIGSEALHKLKTTNPIILEGSSSISNHIRDLRRKINIIYNPEYQLDTVKHEIEKIKQETEKLASDKRFLQISQHTKQVDTKDESNSNNIKIDELYKKLPDFESINATVPLIINRLKTLHVVHCDLSRSVEVVKELDKVINSLDFDLRKWNSSIDQVNFKLEAYEKDFEANKTEIFRRMEELFSQVEKLSS